MQPKIALNRTPCPSPVHNTGHIPIRTGRPNDLREATRLNGFGLNLLRSLPAGDCVEIGFGAAFRHAQDSRPNSALQRTRRIRRRGLGASVAARR